MKEEKVVSSIRVVVLMEHDSGLKLLVIKRKYPPYANVTALPGGFRKDNESSIEGAKRKVLSEVGFPIDQFEIHQLSTRKKSKLDPRGVIVSDNFLCLIKESEFSNIKIEEAKESACWIDIRDVDTLAFDHGAVLCEAIGVLWKKFPNLNDVKSSTSLPEEFSPKSIKWDKEIVFFGGSFYPWHEGHQACLDLCPSQNIVIIPDSNPWKKDELANQRRCLWEEYRELAVKFKDSPYAIFPGYFGIEEGNPTVSWLPKFQIEGKQLLLGTDSFVSLMDWKESKKVIKCVSKLYVVPRDNDSKDQKKLEETLKSVNPNLVIQHLGDHQFKHLSSSEIRKNAL